MNPKRTNYSIAKPSRTSFSLGMDDYAVKTGRSQGPVSVSQQAATKPVPHSDGQSKAQTANQDGASYYQVKPVLSFRTRINYIMNYGLHNPGYLAMISAAMIVRISQKLSVSQAPPVGFISSAKPTNDEALDVGKFIVDHSWDDMENNTAEENAIGLAAASLAAESSFNKIKPVKTSKPISNNGNPLRELSLKAKSNRHKIRSIVTASVACGIILVSSGLMYANSKVLPEGNISGSTSLYVNKAEPKSEAVAKVDSNSLQPDRIKISSLNIDAQSVTVGLTSDNAVDVPEKISDAAWFNGSALPGKPGTTFMLGHYAAGYGGIFDNLAKIKEGDIIELTDHANNSFKYKVSKKDKQKVADINMDAILTSDGENRLVIMTCAGSYIAQNYTDRLIITATPIQ
jgi:LPXTG-site transpeptidase (sortase) family protein